MRSRLGPLENWESELLFLLNNLPDPTCSTTAIKIWKISKLYMGASDSYVRYSVSVCNDEISYTNCLARMAVIWSFTCLAWPLGEQDKRQKVWTLPQRRQRVRVKP